MKIFSRMILILFVVILILTGCSFQSNRSTTNSEVLSPESISTYIINTDQVNITDIPTATNTQTPPIKMLTITMQNQITSTPVMKSTLIPTVDPGNRDVFIHESLENLCRLPCWGLIVPGVTKAEDAFEYLSSISDETVSFKSGVTGYTIRDVIDGTVHHMSIRYLEDEVIRYIFVRTKEKFNEVLIQYGKPEEIFITQIAHLDPEITTWEFNFVLFYPSQGFAVIYSGWANLINDGRVLEICPNQIIPEEDIEKMTEFYLWEIGSIKSFLNLTRRSIWRFDNVERYGELSEVSDLTIEEFYQYYGIYNDIDKCFNIRNLDTPEL